jgi:hypothetical protein
VIRLSSSRPGCSKGDVVGPRQPGEGGGAGRVVARRQRREASLADAQRVDELDRDLGGVGGGGAGAEGDQGAAAGEGTGHRQTRPGEGAPLGLEELGDDPLALRDSLVQRAPSRYRRARRLGWA